VATGITYSWEPAAMTQPFTHWNICLIKRRIAENEIKYSVLSMWNQHDNIQLPVLLQPFCCCIETTISVAKLPWLHRETVTPASARVRIVGQKVKFGKCKPWSFHGRWSWYNLLGLSAVSVVQNYRHLMDHLCHHHQARPWRLQKLSIHIVPTAKKIFWHFYYN
jgi:hypothetical protein